MSMIVNYPAGKVVTSKNFNDPLIDLSKQTSYFNNSAPFVKWGLHISAGSGLKVNVSAGAAEGIPIPFTNLNTNVASPKIPARVFLDQPAVVNVPANANGWIVLNINIIPGLTTSSDNYIIQADDGNGNIGPVYVSALQPQGLQTSYPYSQVVLGRIASNSSTIIDVNTAYSPGQVASPRGFSIEDQIVNTMNNGSINLLGNNQQGTIKIPGFINNLGTNNQVPMPTLSWKFGYYAANNSGQVSNTLALITIQDAFPNKILFTLVEGTAQGTDINGNKHSIPVNSFTISPNSSPNQFNIDCYPPYQINEISYTGKYFLLGY